MEVIETRSQVTTREKLPKNVVIVEKPEARYRIIYGLHDAAQKVEDLGDADALILEGGDTPYSTKEKAERILFGLTISTPPITSEEQSFRKQYAKIIKAWQERKRPIFLADISEPLLTRSLKSFLGLAEPIVGGYLLYNLAKGLKSEKINRRQFLGKAPRAAAKGLAAIYLLSNLPHILVAGIDPSKDERSAVRVIEKFLIDLDERIHPETSGIKLTLRNHLLAQKLKTIGQKLQESTRGKPEVAIVIGAMHTGIESALQKEDAERTRAVENLLQFPGLEEEARRRIATIARLDYNEIQGRWVATEIFKDSHLAPFEQKR